MLCRNEWLIEKRKAGAERNEAQRTHRGGQRRQAVRSMTGLIQGLLNLAHSRNRKIFVGAKKVEDRDVASWSSTVMSGRG